MNPAMNTHIHAALKYAHSCMLRHTAPATLSAPPHPLKLNVDIVRISLTTTTVLVVPQRTPGLMAMRTDSVATAPSVPNPAHVPCT